MKKTVTVSKRKPNDNFGTLYIRVYEKGKYTHMSLGESIEEKYFNKKTQRVRDSHPKASILNEKIESCLNSYNKPVEIIEPEIKLNGISYRYWFNHCISLFVKENTIAKWNSFNKKFLIFLKTKEKKDDILLKDIDDMFIHRLYTHFLKSGNMPSSIDRDISVLKSMINTGIANGKLFYQVSPFINLDIKILEKEPVFLTLDEMEMFENLPKSLPNKYTFPRPIYQVFLFGKVSLFSQGSRVSDVLLLKFDHITNNTFSFNMMKTGSITVIHLNFQLQLSIIEMLKYHLFKNEEYDNLLKAYMLYYEQFIKEELDLNFDDKDDYTAYDKQILAMNEKFILMMNIVKKRIPNTFIFNHFLDPKIFKVIGNEFNKIQTEEIKRKTALINKYLKVIATDAKIEKNLTTKIFRNSFANQASAMGFDIYAIQKALGHSSTKITERYLQRFNFKATKDLNDTFASSINRYNKKRRKL